MSDVKQKIINTMHKMVITHGYDKSSINLIAVEVGVKKAAVYYYFKSKEEILREVLDQNYNYTIKIENLSLLNRSNYLDYVIQLGENYFNDLAIEDQKFHKKMEILADRIPWINNYVETWYSMTRNLIKSVTKCCENSDLLTWQLYAFLIGLESIFMYENTKVDIKKLWREGVKKICQTN